MKEKEIERINLLKAYENALYLDGETYIAGIDEAGRGPLAGPVVVGVVILKKESFTFLYFIREVKEYKKNVI